MRIELEGRSEKLLKKERAHKSEEKNAQILEKRPQFFFTDFNFSISSRNSNRVPSLALLKVYLVG